MLFRNPSTRRHFPEQFSYSCVPPNIAEVRLYLTEKPRPPGLPGLPLWERGWGVSIAGFSIRVPWFCVKRKALGTVPLLGIDRQLSSLGN